MCIRDRISGAQIVDTNGSGHGALAGFLKDLGVDVLICGGIGGGARNALAEAGIELFPGACGDADAQVESYLAGNLNYAPDTVCNHHGHGHGEGNCEDHGQHECGPVSYTHLDVYKRQPESIGGAAIVWDTQRRAGVSRGKTPAEVF